MRIRPQFLWFAIALPAVALAADPAPPGSEVHRDALDVQNARAARGAQLC